MMKKLMWWMLLASQLFIIIAFWAWQHVHHPMGNQLAADVASQCLAYGRLAGLLAAFGILLQLILTGRIKWVERTFGLDRMFRLHHVVGFSLVVLLVAHPFLLTLGRARESSVSYAAQFLDFVRNWDGVLAAVIALVIMLAALVLSVAIVRRRLAYELWHVTHCAFYLAVALAFFHQVEVGGDLVGNPWFMRYWYALYIFVFGNLLFFRIIRPLRFFARHRFKVARVAPETADVTSVYIEGRNMESFRAVAGQFVSVRFLAPGFRWESHPFSISARPDGKQIRLTIKQLGDFTRRIPLLRPGTPVVLDGPHGIFTAQSCRADKVLMMAGGIGITPIRSMTEDLLAAGRDVVLLYGNRRVADIVFERELAALVAGSNGRFRVVHVMSHDPAGADEFGKIDRARIARLVPDAAEREVFLCGPPVMMRIVRADLAALGVPRARIHDERFAL